MNSEDITRAVVSAGVFSGVAWFMSGGNAGIPVYAVSAGLQAAASIGSDTLHRLTMMYPTEITSAVATGGLYTAAQYFLRGETNYLNNYGVSAGSEWVARKGLAAWGQKKTTWAAAAADADGEDDGNYGE